MKTAILMTLLALGVAGCSTSNSGAPPASYDTRSGQGPNYTTYPRSPSDASSGQWQQWRYRGITPSTP
ncbi:hypothetical protein [Pedosphaera parvula]|uniref:Lipoprotein n=1 Tax=Pedosphaera parvula (strain Ellin514) TaxID=320771 RepID=B9XP41_PEDPL|nr:hypothetical protein [Pedosphaera parvula]EEF58397.1 hypothetical protein Cflav_PD6140 [Pedosphaera parvula Ellin514]